MPKVNEKLVNKSAWLLIILGLAGVIVSAMLLLRSHQPPAGVKNVSVESAPSAVKPSGQAVTSYNVPPANPKYISIPAINIKQAEVIQLGLLKNSQIATPNNIYEAGWYNGSSKPGKTGAMFIYGHVSSWQANGLFYDLKKLKAGDTIAITRGDNTAYIYKVVSSKIYPSNNVDMNEVLSPINSGKPGLNMMTCTGKVIKGTSEFNQRLVVFASLVSS